MSTDLEDRREAQEIDDAILRLQPTWAAMPAQWRVLEPFRYLLQRGTVVEKTGINDGVPRWLFMWSNRRGEPDWDLRTNKGLAYCAATVLWGYRAALHEIPGNQLDMRNAANLASRCSELGVWYPPTARPQEGDIFFLFGRRGSDRLPGSAGVVHHCGIVEVVHATSITTIEGNITCQDKASPMFGRQGVFRNTRSLASPDLAGFGRAWEDVVS